MAVDSSGNAIIVWEDLRNSGSTSWDIYAQKLNSTGDPQWGSSDKKVNQNSDTDIQTVPAVDLDPSGDAIVVWQDTRVNNDIYAQKLNSTGDAQWGSSDAQVNQVTTNSQLRPQIAVDSSGFAIVVWEDTRTDFDIYAQKLNTSGNVTWGSSDVKVNQNSDSDDQRYPSIDLDSSGNAIIVWQDDRNTDYDIYAQMLSPGGYEQWGSTDVRVNQYEDGNTQRFPWIAVNPDGFGLIVWEDERESVTDDDIYIQKIDSDGNLQWGSSDSQVNQNSDSASQNEPYVAVDSNGIVFVVWEDDRDVGTVGAEIYAQKLEPNVTGRAYIYYGSSPMESTSNLNLTGENDGDKFGFSVHAAGDISGDGVPDVAVGAPYYDNGATTDAGILYIFNGGSSMDATYDFFFKGTQATEHLGWSVSLAGNMNNDAYNDVAVASPDYDGSIDTGKTTVLCIIPEFSEIIVPIASVLFIIYFYRIRGTRRRKRVKGIRRD